MTELQPSPPGYRGQDEAPGSPSCSPGSFKYSNHGLGPEAANYKDTASPYGPEGYGGFKCAFSAVPNDYVHRRRRHQENDVVAAAEDPNNKTQILDYNDGYKKNTPGYKNDSGYSESIGFDSFSLPLNERDDTSPPPPPPIRDSSGLKGLCYGSGHEKYPSWPSALERRSEEELHGSQRSKSWTDHTNYPKEKPAQYTRPHAKRPNAAFTQQLKTVMERCEKIPAETFDTRSRNNVDDEPRLWPLVDHSGKAPGESDYVPSPSDRDQLQSQTLSHADLEAYVRSYQDQQVSQVDLYRESNLTQVGLEEYTRVQHSQQPSYAQSEGYHSYVSSVDSTTTTPFLDRLRRDSEAVAQRPVPTWEDVSIREGRDSVVTTSSGSASSSETLKWHGSMSDVSVSSGMPSRPSGGDRWHHGSMSDVSSINGAPPVPKPNEENEKWNQSSISEAKINQRDKWQASMNERNIEIGARDGLWQESNIDDDLHSERSLGQWESISVSKNVTPRIPGRSSKSLSPEWDPIHSSMSDVSMVNGSQSSKQLIAHSARVQTPQRHHSESVLYLDRERSQRKLYPVSTTQPQESHSNSRLTPSSPQAQLSVAERISELEKQQQMRYTYLDPEKRHRVSDPTLKAIQKKALLSYYERHHQSSWRSEPQLAQAPVPVRHSPPPQPPPRPRPSSRRASSASDYASGAWREKNGKGTTPTTEPLPPPKHQHSNSCGSLSTDLLGPVIVGPAISIDDWVPERPPKNPHLRSVYNERVPSPDLPPPSPPNVTESEVLNCDDPLPPPPPDLDYPHSRIETEDKKSRDTSCEKVKSDRFSVIRRSRHGKSSKTSPTSTPTKATMNYHDQRQGYKNADAKMAIENGVSAGFATHRMTATGRSSLRYSSTQKLVVNGRVAPVRMVAEERPYSCNPPLPDLISQRYSDSGNQRPSPQVPVEPRILRQDSMKETHGSKLETLGQKPQPQVAKSLERCNSINAGQAEQHPSRPNYLPLENTKSSRSYSKYQQRNYYALPPKYTDTPKQKTPISSERSDRGSPTSPPPPLAPRLNTPGRKSLPPPRPAPPHSLLGSQSKASYLAYRRERGAPDSEGSYKRTMSPTARLDDWPPAREKDDPVLLKVTPHHPHPIRTVNHHHNLHQNHQLSKSHSVDTLHQRMEERSSNNHTADVINKLSRDLAKKLQSSENRIHNENNNVDHLEDRYHIEKRERLSPQSVEVLNDRNRQLERERRKLAANCEPQTRLESSLIPPTDDCCIERSATIEMTSQNVEMLNRKNTNGVDKRLMSPTCNAYGTENTWTKSCSEVNLIDTRPVLTEKPPPPTTSPPSSPDRQSPSSKTRGAIPRRSGSCSSSGSSRSSDLRISPSNLQARMSPKVPSPLDSPTRNGIGSPSELFPARKVSSPTQTDKTGSSWEKTTSPGCNRKDFKRRSASSRSRISNVSSVSSGSSISTTSKASSLSSPRISPSQDDKRSRNTSPCVSPQPGIEGLMLMQRTEVVLRVNAATMDAASQTEVFDDSDDEQKEKECKEPVPEPRKKHPEEIEYEELSRDLASQLSPNDKLVPILVPVPEHKKSTDYVCGLFRVEATLQPRPRRRISLEDLAPTENGTEEEAKVDSIPTTTTDPSPLSATSAYFTTSEGKARFLTRYSRDVSEEVSTEETAPVVTTNSLDLRAKKKELMIRLDKKLAVLRAEQDAVKEETEINEALGARVASQVSAEARSAEASKYRLHVEEVGKITSLLLSLSGRLARAENALYGMAADHVERKILECKRDKLLDQLEEAKVLKGNIDKRSVSVAAIISKYLTEEEFVDYQHFINMKAKLIVDTREIQDKVKLGEEQLAALKEAID